MGTGRAVMRKQEMGPEGLPLPHPQPGATVAWGFAGAHRPAVGGREERRTEWGTGQNNAGL